MLLMQSTKTAVAGTGYTIEYTMTRNPNEYELCMIFEYGIRCTLFEGDKVISSEEIKCITPNFSKACQMVLTLRRNKVFPAHLKDVIYDLIVQEEETDQTPDFRVA